MYRFKKLFEGWARATKKGALTSFTCKKDQTEKIAIIS
jgi:hypothetical protein